MRLHILVVDDDKPVVRCFSDTFLQTDSLYKCTCADNIPHAKKIIEFVDCDYLFINLDTNVGEAFEFITWLKKLHLKKTKIITYSKTYRFYQATSKAFGASICIPPPLTAEIIYNSIETVNIHTMKED